MATLLDYVKFNLPNLKVMGNIEVQEPASSSTFLAQIGRIMCSVYCTAIFRAIVG